MLSITIAYSLSWGQSETVNETLVWFIEERGSVIFFSDSSNHIETSYCSLTLCTGKCHLLFHGITNNKVIIMFVNHSVSSLKSNKKHTKDVCSPEAWRNLIYACQLFALNFVNVSRNLIALLCEEQSSLRVWEFAPSACFITDRLRWWKRSLETRTESKQPFLI